LLARTTNVSVGKLTEMARTRSGRRRFGLKERERDDTRRRNRPAEIKGGRDHHGQRVALRQGSPPMEGKRPWHAGGRDDETRRSRPLLLAVMGLAELRACGTSHAPASIVLASRRRLTTAARRPGPVGACSDADLAEHIRLHITGLVFHGEGYRKIWARLRAAGVRASPRRVRRVMGEHGLLAPHRAGRTEAKAHDGTIVTDRVNEMWGTDMTQTSRPTKARPMSSSLSNTPISEIVWHLSRGAFSQSLRGVGTDAPGAFTAASEPSCPAWRTD